MGRGRKTFHLVLVKPSHYDDDGYVIQWLRSAIPSNTLATLNGLAMDCAGRQVLGPDVDIQISSFDETNTRIRPGKIAAMIGRADGGMVFLVGVQTNQYPRAMDIARPLRRAGISVGIGGFHVSGTIAMLPGLQPEVQEAVDLGISIFAGEAEGRMDEVLRDAWAGTLKPVYNYMNDLPGIEGVPTPVLPRTRVTRTWGSETSFDAGRGCPFQCSFCTIINVQGRKSRYRTPDDIEAIVRTNLAQGIRKFFVTDDNFARNKLWEPMFDRLIHLREVEQLPIKLVIQVDTLCHKIPNFIEKAARAGVSRVFIGLENVNPDNLLGAKKRQNKITEYRNMLLAWKAAGVRTYCGYIIGFPNDTPESIRRDVEILKRELPVDLVEFFMLTPLPGSEDHQKLYNQGIPMDPDLNKYDVFHATTAHSRMSATEWLEAYRAAWDSFYSLEHMETVMRRAATTGSKKLSKLQLLMLWFYTAITVEKVHPLESGFLRLKFRRDRRPTLPRQSIFRFYPAYAWDILSKHARILRLWQRMNVIRRRIEADPDRLSYQDVALQPVTDEDTDELELFTGSDSARAAVEHQRRIGALKARPAAE